MIPNSEIERFRAATWELYGPALQAENYADRAFRFLKSLLPSDLLGYGILNTNTRQLTASFDHHPSNLVDTFQAFGCLMNKYEPFRFDPTVNGGKPYAIGDFYSKRQFRDLDIYQEVHAPMGFEDHCFVHVPSESGLNTCFGLFRCGADFTQRDKELLTLAQSHLVNARRWAHASSLTQNVPLKPELFEEAGFTPRECDVLYGLINGLSDLEIEQTLKIHPDTLKSRLCSIFEKLGVEDRVSAAIGAFHLAHKLHNRIMEMRGGAVSLAVQARES